MAIEVRRPNSSGDETNLTPNDTVNWQMVDEVTADEDTTTVYNSGPSYIRDLYNIQDTEIGTGTINHIKVYARCKEPHYPEGSYYKIAIKSGNTVDESDASELPPYGDYENFSEQWNLNPDTTGSWTWSEINSLQIGISLYGSMCFLSKTKILMGDGGSKNIEDVRIGDIVKSYNEKHKKVENSEVSGIFEHRDTVNRYLVINGRLRVTPNHPLYVNEEWKQSADVKCGDYLLGERGEKEYVDIVEIVHEKVSVVYNLETKENHNYFAEDILVHNKPSTAYCTQVYVEIDYTPAPPVTANAPFFGSNF